MRRFFHLFALVVALVLAAYAVGSASAQGPPGERMMEHQPGLATEPTPLVVNTAGDGDDVTANSGGLTLRDAILAANAMPGHQTIAFAIPGPGPHVIQLLTPLPPITDSVTIDGYTQPGASPNTLDPIADHANDAVLMIELDGSQAGFSEGMIVHPCHLNGSVTITGLAFHNFGICMRIMPDHPCTGSGQRIRIQGNRIGLHAAGTLCSTSLEGIRSGDDAGHNAIVHIGGPNVADSNVISGNYVGINLEGSQHGSSYWIENNIIGANASGQPFPGNLDIAVQDDSAKPVTIIHNWIAFNGDSPSFGCSGIAYYDTTDKMTVRQNSIHDNAGLGFDLGLDGVTPNDPMDGDWIQNYPVLTEVIRDAGTGELIVRGTLNSADHDAYIIDIYANAACDPSGYGEGEIWLGSFAVLTFPFDVAFEERLPDPGLPFVTATATNAQGSTSEFSACAEVTNPETFVVNTTADPGDGVCDAAECTLREALLSANGNPASDAIAFAIPGPGPHVIQPLTELPAIADGVTIDGYTQAGASPNTLWPTRDHANNAVVMIELDGSLQDGGYGLRVRPCPMNGPVTIKGLAIHSFDYGIRIWPDTVCYLVGKLVKIQGNWIGLDASGEVAPGNGTGIESGWTDPVLGIKHDAGLMIGGDHVSDGNVISGNGRAVFIHGSAHDSRHLIKNNIIGPSVSGSAHVGNVEGIWLPTPAGSWDILRNWIAYNGTEGSPHWTKSAILTGLHHALVRRNSIHDNGGLGHDWGYDLGYEGVTPNKPLDRFNYPVLTSVIREASSGEMRVQGTINEGANRQCIIDIYANAACDPSGYGEGQVWLGALEVNTDAAGNADFSATFADPGLPFVTATCSHYTWSTSEFSACMEAVLIDTIKPYFDLRHTDQYGCSLHVQDDASGLDRLTYCKGDADTVTVQEISVGQTDPLLIDVTYGDPLTTQILIVATDVAGNVRACSLVVGEQNDLLEGGVSGVTWNQVAMTCVIDSWFTNNSQQSILMPIKMRIAELSGDGCAGGCTANGASQDDEIDMASASALGDGSLDPAQSLYEPITVQMSDWAPFVLQVDVLGVALNLDAPPVDCDTWVTHKSQPVTPHVLDPGPPGGASYSVFLPLAPAGDVQFRMTGP